MVQLSEQQRQELSKGHAVRIDDPETHELYVIVKADIYARVANRDAGETDPSQWYPLIEAALPEDPHADAYRDQE